jgi:hypothetical protein
MVIDQLLSEPSGLHLILADEINPVLHVAIFPDDEGTVTLHGAFLKDISVAALYALGNLHSGR